MGPIKGDMPSAAKLYATSDCGCKFGTTLISVPHTDILSLNAFYAVAWKTGKYPVITEDKAWVMARPHPAYANPYGDSGAPDHREMVRHQIDQADLRHRTTFMPKYTLPLLRW